MRAEAVAHVHGVTNACVVQNRLNVRTPGFERRARAADTCRVAAQIDADDVPVLFEGRLLDEFLPTACVACRAVNENDRADGIFPFLGTQPQPAHAGARALDPVLLLVGKKP